MTGTPRVTVVLVSYGGRELVVRCLERLRAHTPQAYRVVVVDSCSPDGTGEWLATHLTGATVLRMSENLGFGAGCELGVMHAGTEFVCFLNADVEVTDGWLAPLLSMMDSHPRVGAVAPLMIHPDGRVQESGSVIGGDGWCRTWDEAGSSALPRQIDYASAACLLIRRAAFYEVGGFPPAYHIAYFEDVDLAMALREHGWQSWVQPASVVRHIRHGSSSAGRADELMRRNHGTFQARWSGELAGRVPVVGLAEHPHRRWWLRDQLAPYRVLMIDDRVPQVDRGRGDPRTMAVVQAWRASDERARITFFAVSAERAEQYAPALVDRGIEVVWGVPDAAAWSADRFGLYDVIVAFRPHNFHRVGRSIARSQPQAVRVYDAEALFHRRPEQFFASATDSATRRATAAEAHRLRQEETEAFRWADVAVCISAEEARWAEDVAPDTSVTIACSSATVSDPMPGRADRSGIVFFGGFDNTAGTPNELAVLELVDEVLPGLVSRHPDLDLRIVGADPSPAVLALASERVRVVGKVPDPAPVLGSALLHVVPMRYGAGVKNKFVDSMAAGLPFVTTPVGAEGLHLGWTERHLVGSSPAELIELCHRMLADGPLWIEVQAALVDTCRTYFSPERFRAEMADVIARCVG